MNRTIAKIISLPGTFIHWFVIPLFTFVFCLYYKPYVILDFLSMQNATFSFNATMLLCVLFVTLGITRWGLFAIGKARNVSGIPYLLWCVGELVLSALFCIYT